MDSGDRHSDLIFFTWGSGDLSSMLRYQWKSEEVTLKKLFVNAAFLAMVVSAGGVGAVHANEVLLSAHTPWSKNAVIREAVKNECQLQTKLPDFVRSYAQEEGVSVVLSDKAPNTKKGRVLLMEIPSVSGSGGGAWSGSKSVQVKGRLLENGKQIANFSASRYSGGGMFAGYKGTCSILGRCVKALGKDIASWLKHPTSDARLGDL